MTTAPVTYAEMEANVPAEQRRRNWYFRDPWRKPRILQGFTIAYLAWSILPVTIAILISFTSGRSRAVFQPPLSLRWWIHDPLSLWQNPEYRIAMTQTLKLGIVTVLISVPIGVMFALALHRWRGRGSGSVNFLVLLSFVVPELILGVTLLIFFTKLVAVVFPPLKLGTPAQLIGLITFQISYPVIIVRARLLSIGKEYEEAAMDLGASPVQALRRILLPMLMPAIFVSAVLVFADVIDDFVIVRYLSLDSSSEPMSVKIYTAARGSPVPAINAMATLMLVGTFTLVIIGALAYRKFSKGQGEGSTVQEFAMQI